jgi:hypothetical protein
VITPAHIQFNVQVLLSAGIEPIVTVAEPGAHGATVTGIHGCGVKTPIAAEVAAMTCGLLGDIHMPKGATFFMGAKSMMVAAGMPFVATRFSGVMVKVLGAAPKLHIIVAVE